MACLGWVAGGRVEAAAAPVALVGSARPDFRPGSWSEGVGRWILRQARQGRVLVLTPEPLVDELARYFLHLGAASAEVVEIPTRYQADAPDLYRTIAGADALVFPDVAPWKTVTTWRGTRTESAIRDHWRAGKVLAGFGAGAMLLGSPLADRRLGVLTASEALRCPRPPRLTFTDDFLQVLPGVLIEPAFLREGRLPPLLLGLAARQAGATRWPGEGGWGSPGLAREPSGMPGPATGATADGATSDGATAERARAAARPGDRGLAWRGPLLGLGLDERTALVMEAGGPATVLGEGTVWFLVPSASSVVRLDPRRPPVFTDVRAALLTEGFVVDLTGPQVVSTPSSAVPAFPDPPPASPWTLWTIDGSREEAAAAGEMQILQHTHEPLALQLGLLHRVAGRRTVPWAVLMPNMAAAPELIENRIGGVFWALSQQPGQVGVLLDRGAKAEVEAAGWLTPLPMTEQASVLIIDSREAQTRAASRWKSWPDAAGPRQSVALFPLRLHLIDSKVRFSLPTGVVEAGR